MKQCVLKNLLRGLIFAFTVSAFFSGCASNKTTVPLVSGKFSPEYYIFKKVEDTDFDSLQQFRNAQDPQTAAEASLMLGYYYMRESDLDSAMPLIMQYYNSPKLSPYMASLGKIWRMELSLQTGNNTDAQYMASTIASERDEESMQAALQTYCATMRLFPDITAGYYGCIEARLQSNSIDVNIDNGSSAPLPNIEDLNILITSTKDVSSSIFYYMQEHGMDSYKVRFEKSYIEGSWDFIIDIDNSYLGGPGYGLFFNADLSQPLLTLESYAGLNACEKVVIGAGAGLMPTAGKLAESLKREGLTVETINIADSGTVSPIRNILSNWEETAFCAVAAGSEKEINNFVPNVKQYIRKSTTQKIFILLDVDTGQHYAQPYLPYYAGSFVFPAIDLNMSEEMKEIAASYEENTGVKLDYQSLLAQDMMQFIYLQTADYSKIDINSMRYLSNIVRFEDGKAIRPLRAFYIHKNGEIEQLILSGSDE